MTQTASECLMLTPAGALYAFARKMPDETALALQALLTSERALDLPAWSRANPLAPGIMADALQMAGCKCFEVPCKGQTPVLNWLRKCLGNRA